MIEKFSQDDVESLRKELIVRYRDDFMLFANMLVIPSAYGPTLLQDVMAPFQRECFEMLSPNLTAIRNGGVPSIRRVWIERTKKAGKDSDLAVCLLWLMAFPKRPVLVQVSAANQQQAGIIKRRAESILFYNDWLNDFISIQQNRIRGDGCLGEVVIEATGNSGAKQGDTPDLLVLNELVHVDKWSVNETHMNNADGVPRGMVIILTNAGFKGTKAERWKFNAVKSSKRWVVKEYKGLAPWLSKEDEEDAKQRDPVGNEYKRLWKGEWVSGSGGTLDEESIDRCFVHGGPLRKPEPGWNYFAGLDLGISHDHAAVVVVGASASENRLRVAQVKAWSPKQGVRNDRGRLEIDLELVELECMHLCKLFRVGWFGYDPAAGGSFMAQRLRRAGLPMAEISFSSPKNQDAMARSFVVAVKGGKLECYEDRERRLRRDFGKFQIDSKIPSGYRLTSVSDEWGHADVGTALVICLPKALASMNWFGFSEEDELAVGQGEGQLSEDEMSEMPAELKEMFDDADDPWSSRGGMRDRW